MSDEGIVTGEGVLLDAAPASVVLRVLGGLIDMAVYGLVLIGALLLMVAYLAAVLVSGSDPRQVQILYVVLVVVILVGIPVTVETLSRGRSLGKLAAGIRIVRDDGGAITFRHALVRALIGVVELWATGGSVAMIASAVNAKGKRLGDMAAGTYPLRTRSGARAGLLVTMPPQLAGWARAADVARLPDRLALRCRVFLERAARLAPASRARLGVTLATQVSRYVNPQPPYGTHPEAFLAAVLVERRERERLVECSRVARSRAESELMARLPYGVPDPPW